MPWRPLPRIAFAICTYPFHPSSSADLPLQIGDELYIFEQGGRNGAWYRGYVMTPPSLLAGLTSSKGQALEKRVWSGIFPRDCVDIRELLDEVATSSSPANDEAEPTHFGNDSPAGLSGEWPTPPTGLGARDATGHSRQAEPHHFREGIIGQDGAVKQSAGRRRPPAPVPMLKIGHESPQGKKEPLVDEIDSALREWHSTNLHELVLNREYSKLAGISGLVERLDAARRQLLHQTLTKQELKDVRESAIWDLVAGNKLISGEVIVRSVEHQGRVLTSDDSPKEVSQLQSTMSVLDHRPVPQVDPMKLFHVFIDLYEYPKDPEYPTTFVVSLHVRDRSGAVKPLTEQFSIDPAALALLEPRNAIGRTRTLFTDLTQAEAGEGSGVGSKIYLVVKLMCFEPTRSLQDADVDVPRTTDGTNNPLADRVRNAGFLPGRGSVMWATSRGRRDHDGTTKSRPTTAASSGTNKASAKSSAKSSEDAGPAPERKLAKRTTAVSIVDVSELVRAQIETEIPLTFWASESKGATNIAQDEDMNSLLPQLLPSKSPRYSEYPMDGPLTVQLQSFAHEDSEELILSTPTILLDIPVTQRLGFTGAPTKSRSDIYLTFKEPHLPPETFLSHPRTGNSPIPNKIPMVDLQLTMEVRNANGSRIESCIYPTANSTGHTAWRTAAIERGEAWNQTVRLALPPGEVPGSHIVMSLADASNFPFALCWMPLWSQDAFTRDGAHSLTLYKYDEYTSTMVSGKGAYLSLPWNSKTKDELVTGPIANLRLESYLCSTKYSQDPSVLKLLRWRDQHSNDIVDFLKKFAFVPEIEIVKLLAEVLDALFEMLVEYSGRDEFEHLIFSALVTVLGVVHDKRLNAQPLIDEYNAHGFRFPFAYPSLKRSFIQLLSNSKQAESARQLRATCKVGNHILKFIINARRQQLVKEAGIGIENHGASLAQDLHAIFTAVENLLRDPTISLVGTKTLIVQNFHSWLLELEDAFSPAEIQGLATVILEACADVQGRLLLYRLALINKLSMSNLFNDPAARDSWCNHVLTWIDPYWQCVEKDLPQWRDQVRFCSTILATLIDTVGSMSTPLIPKLIATYLSLLQHGKPASQELSLLFPSTYPFPTRPSKVLATFDEAMIEVSALLASLGPNMAHFQTEYPVDTIARTLMESLQVQRSVLDCDAFPKSWISLHIFHHKKKLESLQMIASCLTVRFLPSPDDAADFRTDLWQSFFSTVLKLVSSDALALETFPEQKRRAVWKIAGDIRETGAELLEQTWDAIGWEASSDDKKNYAVDRMGGYQVQYVPGLVGPIVELCLSVHEGLRRVAISILRTMIISEWALSQDLDVIQTEIISRLDDLFKNKSHSDGILQKIFVAELYRQFEATSRGPDDPLFAAVQSLLGTVETLLNLLMAVYGLSATGETFQLMDTLRLMDFLRGMQRDEMFIGYVYKLTDVLTKSQHHAEAGLALKMHADLYAWDSSKAVEALQSPRFPMQTSFHRREKIYFEMVRNFEEDSAWHLALAAYSELAREYEYNDFDFAKLARTQRAMATIFEKIHRGECENPRYFRVHFRGLGFPPSVRDKQFIFQGAPSDRQVSFSEKLQQQYPSAQIGPGTTSGDLEGQQLSVYPVSPQKDLLHPVNRRVKVAPTIRDHFTLAQPRHFTTTSRRQASTSGIQDQIQEKVIFTTAEIFPTILRRSEIVSMETVRLSPVQIGIERTLRKTQELLALEKTFSKTSSDSAFQVLMQAIAILVRPKSNGCVADYWELVPSRDADEDSGPADLAGRNPLEEALRTALLDHAIAIRRCLAPDAISTYQSTKADLSTDFDITFAALLPSLRALTNYVPLGPVQDTHWTKQIPDASNVTTNGVATHAQREPDTKPGALEPEQINIRDLKTAGVPSPGIRQANGTNQRRAFGPSTFSTARNSLVEGDVDTENIPQRQAPTSPRFGTSRPTLSAQVSLQNLSAHVGSVTGSVTKRLSAFNPSRFVKSSMRGAAMDRMAE